MAAVKTDLEALKQARALAERRATELETSKQAPAQAAGEPPFSKDPLRITIAPGAGKEIDELEQRRMAELAKLQAARKQTVDRMAYLGRIGPRAQLFGMDLGFDVPQSVADAVGGFNIGVASPITGLVDLTNALLGSVGLDSDQPVLGSRMVEDLFEDIGMISEEAELESFAGKTGQIFGGSVSAMIGMGQIGRAAKTLPKRPVPLPKPKRPTRLGRVADWAKARPGEIARVTRELPEHFKTMNQAVTQNWGWVTIGELAVSPVVAAGEALTGEMTAGLFGERARPTGEMVGGVVAGIMPGGAVSIARRAGAKLEEVGEELGVSPGAAERRAGKMLRERMDLQTEMDLTLERIRTDPNVSLTLGQASRDVGVLSFERTFFQRAEEARRRQVEFASLQNKELRDALERLVTDAPESDMAPAISGFRKVVNAAAKRVSDRVTATLAEVNRRVDALTPKTPDDPNNPVIDVVQREVRTIIDDKITSLALAEETRLWNRVGIEQWNLDGIRERANSVIENTSPVIRHTIPAYVWKLAGERRAVDVPTGILDEHGNPITRQEIESSSVIPENPTTGDLIALRSHLNDLIRAENARGDFKRGRFLRGIREAAFEDARPLGPAPAETIRLIDEARAFSRKMHDLIDRGPIGKVRGYDSAGEARVDPEVTLSAVLAPGKTGTDGLRNLQALRRAAAEYSPDQAESMELFIQDYLRAAFAAKALPSTTRPGEIPKFNEKAAERFVNDNVHVLNQYPELRNQMLDAIEGPEMARRVERQAKVKLERLEDYRHVLRATNGGDPEMGIAEVLSKTTPSPKLAARRQMRLLSIYDKQQGTNGAALRGYRRAFYKVMMDRIAPDVRQGLDIYGNTKVNAAKLRNFLKTYGPAVKEVYGEWGYRLIEQVSEGATKAARIELARVSGSDTASNLANFLRGGFGSLGVIIGGRISRGGIHPLLIANIYRRAFAGSVTQQMERATEKAHDLLEVALYSSENNFELARRLVNATPSAPRKEISETARMITIATGVSAVATNVTNEEER